MKKKAFKAFSVSNILFPLSISSQRSQGIVQVGTKELFTQTPKTLLEKVNKWNTRTFTY